MTIDTVVMYNLHTQRTEDYFGFQSSQKAMTVNKGIDIGSLTRVSLKQELEYCAIVKGIQSETVIAPIRLLCVIVWVLYYMIYEPDEYKSHSYLAYVYK